MLRKWRGWLLIPLMLGLVGCGLRKSPPQALTAISVNWSHPDLGSLPLAVAAGLSLDRANGAVLRLEAQGNPSLHLGDAIGQNTAPIFAYLAQAGDWVLLAPDSATGFRWREVRHVPLAETDISQVGQRILSAVLAQHHVTPVHVETLSLAQAGPLFDAGRLPFWLVPGADAATLKATNYHVITVLTASLGPIPGTVLRGGTPVVQQKMAATMNAALTYINTHPASAVAQAAAPYYQVSPQNLTPWIARGQAMGMWPHTVYPGRSAYIRLLTGLSMMSDAQAATSYVQMVDPKAATAALAGIP